MSSPSDLFLLAPDEMAAADRIAVASGIPSLTLMENAGRAVAEEAMKMVEPGARIHVFCGPGNNGGDGFVAARLLAERGYTVSVGLLGERDALKGDAAEMAARWSGEVLDAYDFDAGQIDLYIDALFGAGLSRPLDPDIGSEILTRIGDDDPVLSVDIPSGVDSKSGLALGPVFAATRTVTFFRRKPGHLLLPGRLYCGELVVADIGIPEKAARFIGPRTIENSPSVWSGWLRRPRASDHKYTRGHAVVVSGPAHATGAARLAARGALRIGAGLVTVASPRDAVTVNAAHLTAIMLQPFDTPAEFAALIADKRITSILVGPAAGVGPDTARLVDAALMSDARVVLDADALTSFEASPDALFEATRRAVTTNRPHSTHLVERAVLTPHEGEFRRLFPGLDGSKLDRARAAAALSGAIVVLKGADTVIAAPDGQAAINANAPPWLATAGSGDVLAGFITGLLAQGMPAWEAACASAWLHGECANRFGAGLIAEDIAEVLPGVLGRIGA